MKFFACFGKWFLICLAVTAACGGDWQTAAALGIGAFFAETTEVYAGQSDGLRRRLYEQFVYFTNRPPFGGEE